MVNAIIKSDSFHTYQKAVIGSERSKHTYMKRLNAIRKLAGGYDGKQILDIGCGFGFRTIGVAQHGALSVAAIDVDEQRIAEAAGYARECNVANADFRVMDAAQLEFDNESFDIILADEVIHHLDHLPRGFGEMHRVLQKGGVTVISDHNRLSILSEIVRTAYFGKQKERVFTAKEVKRFLKEANFHDISFKHIGFTMPFARAPKLLLQLNYLLEAFIELTPILRTQCGVFVIRGVKQK